MPAVLVQRTVFYWANAVLPLVARLQVSTLDDAAARETEYAWVHVVQSLCQILAHTILTSLPCVDGEERYMLYVSGRLAVAPDAEVSFGKGALGFDDGSVFLPLLAADVHTGVAQLLVVAHGGVVNKVDPQLCLTAIGHTCPDREAVLLATLHADAEETVILNHRVFVAVTSRGQTYIVRILVEWAVVLQHDLARNVPSCEGIGKLE